MDKAAYDNIQQHSYPPMYGVHLDNTGRHATENEENNDSLSDDVSKLSSERPFLGEHKADHGAEKDSPRSPRESSAEWQSRQQRNQVQRKPPSPQTTSPRVPHQGQPFEGNPAETGELLSERDDKADDRAPIQTVAPNGELVEMNSSPNAARKGIIQKWFGGKEKFNTRPKPVDLERKEHDNEAAQLR